MCKWLLYQNKTHGNLYCILMSFTARDMCTDQKFRFIVWPHLLSMSARLGKIYLPWCNRSLYSQHLHELSWQYGQFTGWVLTHHLWGYQEPGQNKKYVPIGRKQNQIWPLCLAQTLPEKHKKMTDVAEHLEKQACQSIRDCNIKSLRILFIDAAPDVTRNITRHTWYKVR